jgi:hypothetical protein
MRGHGAKYERKKEQAIAALLTHRTTGEAATAAGVGISTLWRWLNEPEVRTSYLKARREAVSQAVARKQQATSAAGVTILKLMTDPNLPAAVRQRAAECVFGLAAKGIEIEDLDLRLSESERAADPSKRNPLNKAMIGALQDCLLSARPRYRVGSASFGNTCCSIISRRLVTWTRLSRESRSFYVGATSNCGNPPVGPAPSQETRDRT